MEKFHNELEDLKKQVLDMGFHALDMLNSSIEAFKNLNIYHSEEIYSRKDKLMEYDNRNEEKALQLIALYQPMARDLRIIACILKMITYLTRIGRYGKDITNITTKELEGKIHFKKIVSIPHMMSIVNGMIKNALVAFDKSDISFLKDFEERDDEVDELRLSIFRECLTYMMESPANISICIAYIMIARYLERCGDHACKMAEKIHYMITGE
ncbi:unnamed protein product, partial [marine sediment metagenome]